MNKPTHLTIEHLSAYLPYGVKCKARDSKRARFYLGGFLHGKPHLIDSGGITKRQDIHNILLILRPLSQLTVPITHNGETFVPLVRLAELALMNTENHKLSSHYIDGYFTCGIRCEVAGLDDPHEVLGFDLKYGFGKHYRPSMNWDIPLNQLKLWQSIWSWHFDTFGLIESGLAIAMTPDGTIAE